MKTLKVSIPLGKDEKVSGVIAVPDNFQKDTTAGELPVQALVFLGYPLHAPGKKDQLRDAHLYDIGVPMLFFAGTRDSLCDLTAMKNVLARFKTNWALEVIDGGDHSFNLLKSAGRPPEQVYDLITKMTVEWLKTHL